MNSDTRVKILAGTGILTGLAGAIAPRLTAKVFGLDNVTDEVAATVRMMSFRNIALAALTRVIDDEKQRKPFWGIATAMFSLDTAASIANGITGKANPRSAVTLGLTTATMAALSAMEATA